MCGVGYSSTCSKLNKYNVQPLFGDVVLFNTRHTSSTHKLKLNFDVRLWSYRKLRLPEVTGKLRLTGPDPRAPADLGYRAKQMNFHKHINLSAPLDPERPGRGPITAERGGGADPPAEGCGSMCGPGPPRNSDGPTAAACGLVVRHRTSSTTAHPRYTGRTMWKDDSSRPLSRFQAHVQTLQCRIPVPGSGLARAGRLAT